MASALAGAKKKRAATCVPYQVTDTGGDRETRTRTYRHDMWSGDSLGDTNGVACIGSLCTSHQFSKPSPEEIRLGEWRKNCRIRVDGHGMLLMSPPEERFLSTEICWQLSRDASPTVLTCFF